MITLKSNSIKVAFLFMTAAMVYGSIQAQQELVILNKKKQLKSSIHQDPKMALVELKSIVSNIRYDLRYATTDNFTGVALYPKNTNITFLRKEPALALSNIAKELEQQGLGIHVWDAFRPYRVTVKFWRLIKDERYVANPKKGSGHNRGIAIDLTLYDLKSGELLDMPTVFDNFSEQAYHGHEGLSQQKKNNRELLRSIMEKHGFIKFPTEWWHYYWPNGELYDVLNISQKQLMQMN